MAWRQHAAIRSHGEHFPVDKTIGTPPQILVHTRRQSERVCRRGRHHDAAQREGGRVQAPLLRPRQSQQKGARKRRTTWKYNSCRRAPGQVRPDDGGGCTPLKSQMNTEPRGALGLLMSLGEKVLIAIPRCTSCGDAGLGRGTELRSIISPKGLKALMYRSLNRR